MAEYKRIAIRAARELHYPVETLVRLNKATTEYQIERIMVDARKKFM